MGDAASAWDATEAPGMFDIGVQILLPERK